ncbi:hypothetical protein SAMN05421686_11157 [Thalassolituus maritimus]|uniref:Uncharacterized protein n=1 Tax=Thalassolituus maritimus TaxID=484498 RepID=A0A1N7PTH4_9GAMM|nr:hypothetical protein SAMN05421686_11157 [Thalassolituus maritimus]
MSVLFCEWRPVTSKTQGIVYNQHLAVTIRSDANADGRDGQCRGNTVSQVVGNMFDHQHKGVGFLNRSCLLLNPKHLPSIVPNLGKAIGGLWQQAGMPTTARPFFTRCAITSVLVPSSSMPSASVPRSRLALANVCSGVRSDSKGRSPIIWVSGALLCGRSEDLRRQPRNNANGEVPSCLISVQLENRGAWHPIQ